MTAGIGKAADVPGVAGVRRVLAGNPSPMTGPGTWTHLIGQTDVAVIDPGPDDPAHLQALLRAIPAGGRVLAIVVTHAHLDHSALAPALARATGAPVLAFGPADHGRSDRMAALATAGLRGGEGVDHAFRPDQALHDGAVISGPDWQLEVLHTPGHMAGHLCLAFGEVLFTGDHVMAWAPSLVSPPDGDMGAYMASLARLAGRSWRQFVPAHGDTIPAPGERLAALVAHRRDREARILAAVRAGNMDLAAITASAYPGLDPALVPAARRNALAHLIDLADRSLIRATPAYSPDALWHAC